MTPDRPEDRFRQLLTAARSRWRQIVAVAAALAVVLPLAWMWQASRMPGEYSVMDMGYVDTGGGPNTFDHARRATTETARSASRTSSRTPTARPTWWSS